MAIKKLINLIIKLLFKNLQGGMYILQLLDWYSASISVILICIIEVVMASWIYGIDNFIDDIYFMIGKKPEKLWSYCWKYVTPSILVVSFIYMGICLKEFHYLLKFSPVYFLHNHFL